MSCPTRMRFCSVRPPSTPRIRGAGSDAEIALLVGHEGGNKKLSVIKANFTAVPMHLLEYFSPVLTLRLVPFCQAYSRRNEKYCVEFRAVWSLRNWI